MKNLTRRNLLLSGFAVTAGALLIPIKKVWAAVELEPSDPMAKRLGYTKNSSKDDQTCSGCAQFQADAGTCKLFAGKQVSPSGWCMSWGKKK